MLGVMRNKFGTLVVWGVVIFVGIVFVFSGYFTQDSTTSGAAAAKVNGEQISISEYNRMYNQRVETYRNYGFKDEQLEGMRLKESIVNELVERALLVQEAKRIGLLPSSAAIREQIVKIPAFQKDGEFDKSQYETVLRSNGYSDSRFEEMVRRDLTANQLRAYVSRGVFVSDAEAKAEFIESEDKRELKYVVLKPEVGQKGVKISKKEIADWLKDEKNLNLAKNRFKAQEKTQYKGKKFESVKDELAKGLIASRKTKEVDKFTSDLASAVAKALKPNKKSENEVNALLKQYDTKVQDAKSLTQKSTYVPGIGEAKDIIKDAFLEKSPIDPTNGGNAKVYDLVAGKVIAVLSKLERADLGKYDDMKKEETINQIARQKQQRVFSEILEKLKASADITTNENL